jgi:hypothetical protein
MFRIAPEQSCRLGAEIFEKAGLVIIGHVRVAVTAHTFEKSVHRIDGRLSDQTEGGLIEIDDFPQGEIVVPVK